MKEGLLISHIGEDFTPIVVIDVDASDAEVDAVIVASLAKWACPPEDFELVHDNDMIEIVYEGGRRDENDGIFRTVEVDMV